MTIAPSPSRHRRRHAGTAPAPRVGVEPTPSWCSAASCGRLLRNPFSVIFSMIQPLVFLALFAPLLPDLPGVRSALQWFVPGIVVMSLPVRRRR